MKHSMMFFIAGIAGLSLIFTACSEDSTSGDCQQRLDESQFTEVAQDTSCDNYERASGYLGMAGFGFSSLLKEGASDNFSDTLGLSNYGGENAEYQTDEWDDPEKGLLRFYESALCLVGPDDLVDSLVENGKCDDSGARDTSKVRARRDLEISFFGTLGELIFKTYAALMSTEMEK